MSEPQQKTMKKIKTITLKKTTGKKTIAQSNNVFTGWIDSDFKNYGTDRKDKTTEEIKAEVYEIEKDGTYKDIFGELGNLDDLVLTQEQIINFCKEYKDLLSSWFNFFLFKVDSEFFVAYVSVYDGRLKVYANRFSHGYVWNAKDELRVVVPQLKTLALSSDPLKLGHSETLENAIKICKENGLKVIKEM